MGICQLSARRTDSFDLSKPNYFSETKKKTFTLLEITRLFWITDKTQYKQVIKFLRRYDLIDTATVNEDFALTGNFSNSALKSLVYFFVHYQGHDVRNSSKMTKFL